MGKFTYPWSNLTHSTKLSRNTLEMTELQKPDPICETLNDSALLCEDNEVH